MNSVKGRKREAIIAVILTPNRIEKKRVHTKCAERSLEAYKNSTREKRNVTGGMRKLIRKGSSVLYTTHDKNGRKESYRRGKDESTGEIQRRKKGAT